VTIHGDHFEGAPVTLDRGDILPQSRTDTEIRLQMPAHDSGFGVVRIGSAAIEFLYIPPNLQSLPPGYITTVAGVGQYVRDYGPASQASFSHALGLEFDSAANLYIVDNSTYIVYRVRPDGTIERFAGAGNVGGEPNDGGPAINGFFVFPRDIAIDGNDNVYIPDVNCRVRRVDRNGVITTVAGTGTCGFSGDGGRGTDAQIGEPTFLAADASDVFFIDWNAMRVRRLHLADGTISTFAGNGVAGLSGDGGPAITASFNVSLADNGGLALDPDGNVFLADDGNARVRRIDRRTGVITTFCPTEQNPRAVAFDRAGNLYVAYLGKITKIDSGGRVVASWGNGHFGFVADGTTAATAPIGNVAALAIESDGNIVYSDDAVQRVRRINLATGSLETVAGIGPAIIGENGPALATLVATSPEAEPLAMTAADELLIGDAASFRLRRLERDGRLTTLAGDGLQHAPPNSPVPATSTGVYPVAIIAMPDAIDLSVRSDILRIDSKGMLFRLGGGTQCGYKDGGPFSTAPTCQPWDIARDRDGNLFIADTNNNRVRRVDAQTNIITTIAGNGGPVSGFERYGNGKSCGDGGPALDACINTPYGLAFDEVGNLYVAEQTGIRRIDRAGRISMFAPKQAPSGLGGITKLAYFHGVFYFAGGGISRVDSSGTIAPIFGTSHKGSLGDGGPAVDARTNTGGQGVGITVDSVGNIYFADIGNHRIRAIRYGAVLAPSGATITAIASGTTLRALVRDSNGQPAASVRVDFTAPGSGASCVLSSPSAITDINGTASVSCTPNCVPGTYTVTAQPLTASSLASVKFTNAECSPRRRAARH